MSLWYCHHCKSTFATSLNCPTCGHQGERVQFTEPVSTVILGPSTPPPPSPNEVADALEEVNNALRSRPVISREDDLETEEQANVCFKAAALIRTQASEIAALKLQEGKTLISRLAELNERNDLRTQLTTAERERDELKTDLAEREALDAPRDARIVALEAELALADAESDKHWAAVCEDHKAKLHAAESSLKVAGLDTARIDWLDENMSCSGGGSGATYCFSTPADVESGMLRAAIDAARLAEGKT